MREGESARRAEGRSHLIVWGDGSEVPGVEVVQLANEKIDVVRGERIVLLQIVECDEGKSSRKIPPKDMNGGTGVLGGTNNMDHRGVKGKGGGDVDLNNNQGIMMDLRAPLKIMKCANEKRRGGETCV